MNNDITQPGRRGRIATSDVTLDTNREGGLARRAVCSSSASDVAVG